MVIKKDIEVYDVYVVVKKGNRLLIEKRQVNIGMSYQDKSMITDGLIVGDKVVVKGYNVVSTGIPVAIK